MALQRFENYVCILLAIACLAASSFVPPPGYSGQVSFNGFAVPGVTVTATQDAKKFVAVTDDQGVFTFPDITNGTWTIQIEMSGFATMKDQVVVGPNMPVAPPWELKMLPLDEMKAEIAAPVVVATGPPPQAKADDTKAPAATSASKQPGKSDVSKTPAKPGAPATPAATPGQNAAPPATPPDEPDQRAADGFLINGSVNNGASSPFAQMAAFGNSRAGGRSLYNGGLGLILDNSALDANSFALSGHATAKPVNNRITGTANFGGPMKIPHLLKNGPYFFIGYQWTRNNNDTIGSGLVPTLAERGGDLSALPVQIFNPVTGTPFTNNQIPVSTQAASLLNLFPQPNLPGNPQYNYQTAIINAQHVDALNSVLSKSIGRKDSLSGQFAFQSSRSSAPNLFGFVDTTDALGLNLNGTWSHRFSPRLGQSLKLGFSRQATQVFSNFENVTNISGTAGITGNNQDAVNWGPPTLGFSTLNSLSDGQSSHNRNQTASIGYSILWSHRNHSVTFGADYRRQEFNKLSQQDPRGTFTFTGAATAKVIGGVSTGGSDFADFLLGVPDTSSIAFGNADKYFRQSVYAAYVDDDWRVTPQLSVHVGARWDYGSPITELFGRLVNLDIASNFGAIAPVIANNPTGTVTNQTYPSSLVRPDKHGIQPRLGLSWRPISGSSILVKAGYSINFDTSVYQSIASLMAQQAPLSKSLLVQNSAACPLTLANGFNNCPTTTADTFAIDPNFRVGYVQTWQLSVQRDLPWSLQMTATYLGNKGTRGAQEFLPNTYPIGATNPCPGCPVGFAFLTSNGNSTRESGSLQVRRRLRAGLTSTLTYTYSKSIDDDSTIGGLGAAGGGGGCAVCAQDWLNLGGQRGLSNFDQRHLLTASWQYTTGMGIGGKTLLSGWRGRVYKEWTFTNTISVGSGLPQTPIFQEPVPGTGFTGTIRPDLTGAPIYTSSAAGVFLNPAAFTAPVSGQWGTAARNSITGPAQFSLNASLQRSFHLKDRYNLTAQFDANNLLNHVTYTSWNTIITPFGNPLFGTAAGANQMRTIRTTLRLRF